MSDLASPAAPPARFALLAGATGALALWLGLLVLVLARVTERADAAGLRLLGLEGGTGAARVARVVTDLGSGPSLSVLLPVLALPLLAWRGAGLGLAVAPVAAVAVTGALGNMTKAAVGRERPPEAGRLVETHTLSFPSGHAASAAAGLVAFALLAEAVVRTAAGRAAIGVLAGGGVVAVGWSRIALAVHWPTDVLAGWALGAAVACLAVLVTREIGARPRRRGAARLRAGPRGPPPARRGR